MHNHLNTLIHIYILRRKFADSVSLILFLLMIASRAVREDVKLKYNTYIHIYISIEKSSLHIHLQELNIVKH